MYWARLEQVVVLLAAAAALAGAGALLAVRRPPPAIQVFDSPPQTVLIVQVDGAVVHPGHYHLPPGSRTKDAIVAAGGPTFTADLSVLNTVRILRDGERVTVPFRTGLTGAGDTRADLNTAGAGELEELPGIGPVLARRIIAHRTRHGPFHRLEDLLQVEGIGPRLLDRLRPHVVIR